MQVGSLVDVANRFSAALAVVLTATLQAELASWGDPLPRSAKPPVVFITGHDALCPDPRSGEIPYFELTFGEFDRVMARDGRVSLVFEACYAANRPPIEEIGNLLGQLLTQLRFEDGEPVREVDVVAHSMGGLILRSYLSGKQTDGTFVPPPSHPVRKAVFIGTPHFGTSVAASSSTDPQLREMSLGSKFVFDLATWNQGLDDFRGVDALAVLGTAGQNGPATDSVVTLNSGSIDFAAPGRSAVFPLCHTQGGLGQLFLCHAAPGLARVKDETHPTARLVLDFLNGAESWATVVTETARANPVLAGTSGLLIQRRTADDNPLPIRSASVIHDNGAVSNLQISDAGLAFGDILPAGPARLHVDGMVRTIVVPRGGSRAMLVKPGPLVEAVEPAVGGSRPLVLAPGMLVSVRGVALNSAGLELQIGGKPAQVLSAGDERLTAALPEDISTGLSALALRTPGGMHTVRVWIESAFPALSVRDRLVSAVNVSTGRPVSPSDPALAGETISIFLTGLGATTERDGLRYALQQPAVSVGDETCEVVYAGRAPSMPGVDQINCRLAPDLTGGTHRLQVTSGLRTASADLPVTPR